MVKAVIFDLDDTLVSENQYQKSARKAVLNHLASKTGLSNDVLSHESDIASRVPRQYYFQTLLPRLGLNADADAVAELVRIHREHVPSITWYSDVLASFDQLRAAGAKLGIITDGYAATQRQKICAVQADDYVDAIVVSDELGREYWKPHPKTFLLIADMLKVNIRELMYVGDNPEKDFFISSTLPISTVRVNREDSLKGHHDYMGGIQENYTVSTMSEIVALFNQLKDSAKK